MIKILHLFTTLDGGGVESFLYNYYSHIDHNKIIFDMIVPGTDIGYLEKPFKEMGSTVFHVERLKKNPLRHIREVGNIIKNGNYDIIHCHGYKSAIGIVLGKFFGIRTRIIHSHMAYVKENKSEKIIRKILTYIVKRFSTDWFACGIDAAKWLFGEKEYLNGDVEIINNAIDISKYAYNTSKRNKIRKELNIDNDLVIGNVGRLTYQKNQMFLIDILQEIIREKPNTKLLLVGDGEDREKLLKYAKKKNLENNVIFLGMRKDVPEILSAMDFFILSSRYEGLPVVLAEVQAAGLMACVSDTVTKEIDVTGNFTYLPLEIGYIEWAHTIKKMLESNNDKREKTIKKMRGSKYDIEFQAKKLVEKYIELIKKNERYKQCK